MDKYIQCTCIQIEKIINGKQGKPLTEILTLNDDVSVKIVHWLMENVKTGISASYLLMDETIKFTNETLPSFLFACTGHHPAVVVGNRGKSFGEQASPYRGEVFITIINKTYNTKEMETALMILSEHVDAKGLSSLCSAMYQIKNDGTKNNKDIYQKWKDMDLSILEAVKQGQFAETFTSEKKKQILEDWVNTFKESNTSFGVVRISMGYLDQWKLLKDDLIMGLFPSAMREWILDMAKNDERWSEQYVDRYIIQPKEAILIYPEKYQIGIPENIWINLGHKSSEGTCHVVNQLSSSNAAFVSKCINYLRKDGIKALETVCPRVSLLSDDPRGTLIERVKQEAEMNRLTTDNHCMYQYLIRIKRTNEYKKFATEFQAKMKNSKQQERQQRAQRKQNKNKNQRRGQNTEEMDEEEEEEEDFEDETDDDDDDELFDKEEEEEQEDADDEDDDDDDDL